MVSFRASQRSRAADSSTTPKPIGFEVGNIGKCGVFERSWRHPHTPERSCRELWQHEGMREQPFRALWRHWARHERPTRALQRGRAGSKSETSACAVLRAAKPSKGSERFLSILLLQWSSRVGPRCENGVPMCSRGAKMGPQAAPEMTKWLPECQK